MTGRWREVFLNLSIRDLVSASGGQLLSGVPTQRLQQVSTDTRSLKPGDIYFALEGPRFDGHDFVRTAAERGAAAVVVRQVDERVSRFSASRTPAVIQVGDTLKALQAVARAARSASAAQFIGITGSNGKTTTKEMVTAILRDHASTFSTRGNLNNHIGLPLSLCEVPSDAMYAVVELGTSKPGDMELLVDLARPRVGLITNVGKDHLEFVGTPEGMLEVNRPLVDQLPENGIAVLNADDPLLASLKSRHAGRTVTFGFSEQAEVRGCDVRPWPMPLRFGLMINGQRHDAILNAPGRFQVLNALAAAATAYALEIPVESILKGLAAFKPAAMRMQTQVRGDGVILINDAYNANPSSMRASIESFSELYPDRARWLVLGDMRELGSAAREEHAALGEWLATQPIHSVFLYGRDSRFIEKTLRGVSGRRVERFRKKRYLVARLRELLVTEKPAVLFKASRSMRLEDIMTPLL